MPCEILKGVMPSRRAQYDLQALRHPCVVAAIQQALEFAKLRWSQVQAGAITSHGLQYFHVPTKKATDYLPIIFKT